ncbi:cytochrome b/b6 domain-containing protein [Phaeobacter sp. QD34_3]|uniref:cytochrome b/b6 domain-containing protein n=1 Tax=unclassified Phaeobacter TaxID=2621772 RepID=UPI00237EFC65|nr:MULTISPECIES: cytochrome b/b6 domain-containing protein [unclassified Phaeobacter]MDE4133303.1 cytochrome b/b6 domain-containing protein [Phaeobacter sp. QD34_3]MDE4136910.1 cytochrome b/b6 domain-containing protein [Phaeobacter sp. QD34_24]
MQRFYVWDPLVRLFHWSLVVLFLLNAVITDPEAKLHENLGYLVVALVLLRLVWGLFGSRYARFTSFPPSPAGAVAQLTEIATGRGNAHKGHSPLGALMIYNLLLSLIGIGLSGYLMTTDMFWGTEWPEDLHEALVTWAEISVLLHVGAVIFESRRTRVNLARAMITGYKEMPTPETERSP